MSDGRRAPDPMTPSERAGVLLSACPELVHACLTERRGTGGGITCELELHHLGPHVCGEFSWPVDYDE